MCCRIRAVNLVRYVGRYEGDPVFDHLFDALARVLHRREYPHALPVGERGVGKSTLIAEFAYPNR